MAAIRNPFRPTFGSSRSTGHRLHGLSERAGYPFMIQLVGHSIWRQHPKVDAITLDDVKTGVAYATRRIGSLVHGPSLHDCSEIDRTYLLAMAKDDGPSHTREVARRMNAPTAQYAGQYRQRLIDAELITPAGWGKVDFTIPYMREFLREHAAFDQLPD